MVVEPRGVWFWLAPTGGGFPGGSPFEGSFTSTPDHFRCTTHQHARISRQCKSSSNGDLAPDAGGSCVRQCNYGWLMAADVRFRQVPTHPAL